MPWRLAVHGAPFEQLGNTGSDNHKGGKIHQWSSYLKAKAAGGIQARTTARTGQDIRPRSWRPATLQPVVLITVVFFTSTVIAAIQLLRYYTATDNGVAFSPTDGSFTSFTTFGYLYFPTIIAVCFSMLWNWIDLDVKRLEPFFQLGSAQGASMQDSLFLQYPFDYVALVPLQAARRRHWSVLLSGAITVLIFWAITPLQNSMISTSDVERVLTVNGSMVTSLSAINEQLPNLDMIVLQDAWATLWYNQSLPASTAKTSTYAPFVIDDHVKASFANGTVTGVSQRYWTSFDCNDARFMYRSNNATSSSYFAAVNEDGCEIALISTTIDQLYIGQTSAPGEGSYSFASRGTNCQNTTNTVLLGVANAGWGNQSDLTDGTATAQFCRLQYWTQEGRLTVSMKDLAFQDFQPSGVPALLEQSQFNTTEFEALLASGVSKGSYRAGYQLSYDESTGNVSSITSLEMWAHYHDPSYPNTPVIGFMNTMLNNTANTGVTFNTTAPLVAAIELVHQFLFAIALSHVFAQITTPDSTQTLNILIESNAVVLVDPLAAIVQGFLGAVCLLCFALLLSSARRQTKLDSNPDSLAQISNLLEPNSVTALAVGSLRRAERNHTVENSIFHTNQDNNGSRVVVHDDDKVWDHTDARKDSKDKGPKTSKLPFHLSCLCGLLFVVSLTCATALLAALQKYSLDHNGIPVPSENQIVQQLVLNYIPIVFATFVEPFWTLLNRSLCLLQPIKELKSLQATASRSIETRYSSLPPQMVFFRALGNRHTLLSFVCLVAVSSNILAVTMGALFSIQQVQTKQWLRTTAASQALFNATGSVGQIGFAPNATDASIAGPFQDHFYVAQTDILRGTSLPAWTSDDLFFLPQSFESTGADQYNVTTRGFGIRTLCQDLAPGISNGTITPLMSPISVSSGEPTADVGYLVGLRGLIDTGDGIANCSTDTTSAGAKSYSFVNGTAAYENFDTLMDADIVGLQAWELANYTSPHGPTQCSEMFIGSFGRTNNVSALGVDEARAVEAAAPTASANPNFGGDGPCHSGSCRNERKARRWAQNETALPLNITSQTHLACRSYVTTGLFVVTIDQQNKVIAYTNVSSGSENATEYFKSDSDRKALISAVNGLVTDPTDFGDGFSLGRVVWHQSLVARQWLPYMMMIATGSSSIVDATKPAPSAEELIPMVSSMTEKLGAILLSLYQEMLFPYREDAEGIADATTKQPGQAFYYTSEDRVFMDPTMYAITMALLCVHVVAAIVVYFYIPRDVVERLPTTLADQLGFFEGSSLIEERGWKKDWKYGYGRFLGADGKPRIGIERAPYVQPLDINRQERWWAVWKR